MVTYFVNYIHAVNCVYYWSAQLTSVELLNVLY